MKRYSEIMLFDQDIQVFGPRQHLNKFGFLQKSFIELASLGLGILPFLPLPVGRTPTFLACRFCSSFVYNFYRFSIMLRPWDLQGTPPRAEPGPPQAHRRKYDLQVMLWMRPSFKSPENITPYHTLHIGVCVHCELLNNFCSGGIQQCWRKPF